jgi:3-oxoacyl-[acyl-carrier-protein] synthase II
MADTQRHPIVVVTGLGVVTSLGAGKADNWAKLTAGQSGIRKISRFPTDGLKTRIAGTVDFIPTVEPFNSTALAEQLALTAAEEAVGQANIASKGDFPGPLFLAVPPVEVEWPERKELADASGANDNVTYDDMLRVAARFPAYHARHQFASVADTIAETFGTKGSPISLSTANDDPSAAAKPFAKNRDGFVMAEGAGALVLESLEHAKARGARILGVITGAGEMADSFHRTRSSPDGRPIIGCIKNALADAGLAADEIDYVNAHGTGTPENDKMEHLGVSTVFGERMKSVPISSNKSMVGHTLSAAGAVEAVFTLLTIAHQRIPPTINYQTPDPAIPLDVVPNVGRDARIRHAISNSFGFGGQNVSLVLSGEPA